MMKSLGLEGKFKCGRESVIQNLDFQFDIDKLIVFDQLTLAAADKRK